LVRTLRGAGAHETPSLGCQINDRDTIPDVPPNQAALESIFPHRQARTARPPPLKGFAVRTRRVRNPRKEVSNERFWCVHHGAIYS